MLEETRIIVSIRNGDHEAFTEIVKYFHNPIMQYIFRLTGDYETVQDLTQETFLRAYENISKTSADISLKAWLYRIATNVVYNERKKLISFFKYKQHIKNHHRTFNNPKNITDENLAVHESLLKIPENYRICLILHFIEGFKYHEISETLQISEESVRKRVSRGKDSFIRYYNDGGK
jgi:RNA polymerase sigma-70 factor, ECF subfamily